MTISAEEKQIKAAIKKLMKKKMIDQKKMAEGLGVSLPTVRRTLTKEKITVDRLVEICKILEIDIKDLISVAINQEDQSSFMTEEQEDFLSVNPNYFMYLRCLGQGLSPNEIEIEFGISEKSTKIYILKLENLNLIRLKDQKVSLMIKWPHSFLFPGSLQKKFHRSIARNLVDHLVTQCEVNQKNWSTEFFNYINTWQLSRENYKKCVADYFNLRKKYHRISKIDKATLNWRQLITCGSILGIDKIDPFPSVIGPLKNI